MKDFGVFAGEWTSMEDRKPPALEPVLAWGPHKCLHFLPPLDPNTANYDISDPNGLTLSRGKTCVSS